MFTLKAFLYTLGIACCLLLYLLPSLKARKHKRFGYILLVNLLLGWTLFGWIFALLWAKSKEASIGELVLAHVEEYNRRNSKKDLGEKRILTEQEVEPHKEKISA